MNRLFSAKPVLAAAVAFGALAAASAAHARADVVLSIGMPYGYVQPAPVYVQPQPVYVQPQPYYAPQTYYPPQTYYVQPQPVYGYNNGYYHHNHRRAGWADNDGDGVPNRYDRAPNNPYRR